MNPDYLIAQRILHGDEDALSVFYDAHFERVYYFVLARVDGNHSDAEDVVQDTFLACLRTLGNFAGGASLYSWLCAIAKHKVLDLRRREARRRRLEIPFTILENDYEDSLFLHRERASSNDHQELVQEALLSLPDHYQSVLTQKYVDQRTTKEIADSCGQSAKAAESLLTRARNAFRKTFRMLTQVEVHPG